jgi:ATP-dependent Clp protease ATP-binding subunit ClpA
VSSKKNNSLNKKLFSLQLKKAIFYAFYEAKKHGSDIVDSQYLLYGLLKADSSLANRLIKKILKDSDLGNSSNKLLDPLKANLKNKNKKTVFSTNKLRPNFSRPVRKLLFLLIKSSSNKKQEIITTLHVLKYLLRNKNISKWVQDNLRQEV